MKEAWAVRREAKIPRHPSKDAMEFLRVLDTIWDVAPEIFNDFVCHTFWHERVGLAYTWHDFLMDEGWSVKDREREMKKFRSLLRRIGPRTFYNTIRDVHLDFDDDIAVDSWKQFVKFARQVDKEEMRKLESGRDPQ